MTRNILLASTAVFAIVLLTGCSSDPVSSDKGKVPPHEVTLETAAAATLRALSETQEMENLLSARNPAPENLLEPPELPSFGVDAVLLAKRTEGVEFSIDTAGGKVTVTKVEDTPLGIRHDTIELLLDETIFDEEQLNESVICLRGAIEGYRGTTESYSLQDLDGDLILNGKDSPQRLTFTLHTAYSPDTAGFRSGEETRIVFGIGAGEDNRFETLDDNSLGSVSWVKTDGSDTLARVCALDADGDGRITTGDKNITELTFFERRNPFTPLVEYIEVRLRIERDEDGRERTLLFNAEQKLFTGRMNRVRVVDSTGDSIIEAGEIALVHFTTGSPAASDSEITGQAVFTVDPGTDLCDATDNRLLAMTVAKRFRLGDLDSVDFRCTFDPAVPHGEKASAASFVLTATGKDGRTATLEGTYTEGLIEADFTVPEGNSTGIVYRVGEDLQ